MYNKTAVENEFKRIIKRSNLSKKEKINQMYKYFRKIMRDEDPNIVYSYCKDCYDLLTYKEKEQVNKKNQWIE